MTGHVNGRSAITALGVLVCVASEIGDRESRTASPSESVQALAAMGNNTAAPTSRAVRRIHHLFYTAAVAAVPCHGQRRYSLGVDEHRLGQVTDSIEASDSASTATKRSQSSSLIAIDIATRPRLAR